MYVQYGEENGKRSFFTVLGQRCPAALCQDLENLFDNIDTKNEIYWEKFGYKYLGMLSLFPWEKISEALKQLGISNVFYAESILQLYYGEEKFPQNKDIISQINSGIQKFLSDAEGLRSQITLEMAMSGIIYLADYVSPYDEKYISSGKKGDNRRRRTSFAYYSSFKILFRDSLSMAGNRYSRD